jgi:hypothetical protein
VSFEEYSHARGDDFHSCGGVVTSHTTEDVADGEILLIGATIVLTTEHEAVLEIDEVVVSRLDGEHRERYAYRFFFEGLQIFGYDRDARNHPDMPEHKHIGDRRIAWGPVTFRQFVDEVWEWINERGPEFVDST